LKSKPILTCVAFFSKVFLSLLLFFLFSSYSIREKAERVNDPNVEYIDFNDFKGNGKYAPSSNEKESNQNNSDGSSSTNTGTNHSKELAKAQNILLESHQVFVCLVLVFFPP
jgi:hypothetical protein